MKTIYKTEEEQKLIEIAKEIIKYIDKSAISGSVGLIMQNIKVRRFPKDIDIYVPFGIDYLPMIADIYENSSSSEDDEKSDNESNHERLSFIYK